MKLNHFTNIGPDAIVKVREAHGTPVYLYDESFIIERCKTLMAMPHAFEYQPRYAMKANSNRTLLQIIYRQGLHIDASSLNEVKRANLAGIPYEHIILTAQEVQEGEPLEELKAMMKKGLKYNVCSLQQLEIIGDFAKKEGIALSIRIHPGIGSGESASRNTGDDYCCFGIHLTDVEQALKYAAEREFIFSQVHIHIGSGADPDMWQQNIDLELEIVDKYFPDAETISFGGGLKDARVPGEKQADVMSLGNYAKEKLEAFYKKTGRKLKMEIEPGTFVIANGGYIITRVMDKKRTGDTGLNFIIADGGMEVNARPIMYGSLHPFYIVSQEGVLLSSEFDEISLKQEGYHASIVGKCCETGDSQCLDEAERNVQRRMAEPQIGDSVVIGGAGAYCSSMTPFNYNSHTQVPEVLFTQAGEINLIRRRQTLEQMLENEI